MNSVFNRFARQALVFLATLCFLAVSTLALAHGHADAKLADEFHCPMCMAVHRSTHAVAAPNVTLSFTAVKTPFLVARRSLLLAFASATLTQDRAPPSL
jgi:hypothetical protein